MKKLKELKLQNPLEHVILKVRTGSHCHGTALPTSDTDYRGIIVPPIKYVLGLKEFDHWKNPDEKDEEYYALMKFFRMAIKGNMAAINILFTAKKDIIATDTKGFGQWILNNRKIFLSMNIVNSIYGYCKSQLHLMHIGHGRAGNRSELVEKHGYDTKFGYHALMLTILGIELLKTGSYCTLLKDDKQKEVMLVRNGIMTYDDCMNRIHGNLRVMRTLESISVLADKPNEDVISDFLVTLQQEYYAGRTV